MKTKKRIRKLERRVTRLEDRNAELPPVNTVRTRPVDADDLWRGAVNDYSAAWCGDEDWRAINGRGYL